MSAATKLRTEDRVATRRAAQMMDRVKPGWFRRIVFKWLDLADSCNCIAAQAGLSWEEMQSDFDRENPDIMAAPFADNDLREDWIAEIRKRRNVA